MVGEIMVRPTLVRIIASGLAYFPFILYNPAF
jgi:hypothetical protein